MLNFTVDKQDLRPVYIQIVDEIRRLVAIGTLRDGDALPSVRQLAIELGVNSNTVKQGYRELERAGIVRPRRGEGTFVAHGQKPSAERNTLAGEVAARALRDAKRHDLSAEDLVAAIRESLA